MATTNPTPNYDWVLPVPGGSIGAWGTILNKIFGEDSEPLGIDGVLRAIADDVDDAEDDIDALDTRVGTLEASGTSAFYARLYRSGNQNIAHQSLTQVVFNAESFDQGGLSSDGPSVEIPAGGGGVYQVRAQVLVPVATRAWRMEIQKDGVKIAEGNYPQHAATGNATLSAAVLDPSAVEGTEYTVHVFQSRSGVQGDTAALQGGEAVTFLEAVRLVAA
jgi:hypothetical protein